MSEAMTPRRSSAAKKRPDDGRRKAFPHARTTTMSSLWLPKVTISHAGRKLFQSTGHVLSAKLRIARAPGIRNCISVRNDPVRKVKKSLSRIASYGKNQCRVRKGLSRMGFLKIGDPGQSVTPLQQQRPTCDARKGEVEKMAFMRLG